MRTHEECRRAVCVICMDKSKTMRIVSRNVEEIVQKHFVPNINRNDVNFPLAICGTCRLAIIDIQKTNNVNRNIKLFDYNNIKKVRVQTRNIDCCDCTICKIARSKATNISKLGSSKVPRGRPRTLMRRAKLIICSKCLNTIKRGYRHSCKNKERVGNLKRLSGSPKTIEKLTSSIILEKTRGFDNKENISLSRQSGGHPIKLSLKSTSLFSSPNNPTISADFVSNLKTELNMSTNQSLKLASQLRNSLGPSLVQPLSQVKSLMLEKTHMFDQYFKCEMVNFTCRSKKNSTISPEYLVYCQDVPNFIAAIVNNRKYSADVKLLLKIGLDSGGQFLKVCMNIHDVDIINRVSNSKDTSVKKLFILAIAPDVQENYSNMLLILDKLNLQNPDVLPYPVSFSNDLKMNNIILGIMSHSSKHPCCWCDVSKSDLISNGCPRSFESIRNNYNDYCRDGKDVKRAKNFQNCINDPIFKLPMDVNVLDFFPPPELHLLLGITNLLYQTLENELPDLANDWRINCNLQKQQFHGGHFNGNACRKLLKHINFLEENLPLNKMNYFKVFDSFNKVVIACFGINLSSETEFYINNFKTAFTKLSQTNAKLHVTPKVHTIFHHVQEFCAKTEKGLGLWSEQASESVHSDFKKTWHRFKLNKDHERFGGRFIRAVCEYNSLHV